MNRISNIELDKFIVLSDTHYKFNYNKSLILSGGITTWLDTQLNITETIFKKAIAEDITTVFHVGDMFEEKNRISFTLYNAVWEIYNKYSKQLDIVFLTGNHDVSTVTGVSTAKPFSGILTVIDQPTELVYYDTYILMIPQGMLFLLEEGVLSSSKKHKKNILFTHEDYSELVYGDGSRKEDGYNKDIVNDWDVVFNGHIHKPQLLNNIYNVGSIMIGDWGAEGEQKRYLSYENDNILSISIDHPDFITVDNLTEEIRNDILNNGRDYFRVDIGTEEVKDEIFNKYNVEYRIIKSSERKLRLDSTLSSGDEIKEYVNISDTNLDRNKLIEIGKELII